MMKVLSILFMVAIVATAKPLSDELKEAIMTLKKECMESTGVELDVVMEFKKGNYQEDDKLKNFFFCFFGKAGFINESGAYQIEAIKTKFVAELGAEEGEKLVTECTGTDHGSAAENSFQMAKCFHAKAGKDCSMA